MQSKNNTLNICWALYSYNQMEDHSSTFENNSNEAVEHGFEFDGNLNFE